MAAGDKNFKVNVAISLIPVEETTLADGTTVRQDVHSTIDKGAGSQHTVPADEHPESIVLRSNFNVSPGPNSVYSLFGAPVSINALFVKIVGGPPNGTLSIYSGVAESMMVTLSGIGDFTYLPLPSGGGMGTYFLPNVPGVLVDVLIMGYGSEV